MIDDLFNLIINKSSAIPKEFYNYLEKIDMLYTKEIIETAELGNSQILKDIIFTLYELFNSRCKYILNLLKRDELIVQYNICKDIQDKSNINNFIAYYKKSLINKYLSNIC